MAQTPTQMYRSNWVILRRRADDFYQDCAVLAEAYRYAGALQMLQHAIEVLLKAAISKQLKEHPWGHDLDVLAAFEWRNGYNVASRMVKEPQIVKHFATVSTAWNVHLRYTTVAITTNDFKQTMAAFRAVYRWIQQNFV